MPAKSPNGKVASVPQVSAMRLMCQLLVIWGFNCIAPEI
jgi:hypothetical protein